MGGVGPRRRGCGRVGESSEQSGEIGAQRSERLAVEAVAGARSLHRAGDQPRLLQHLDMLRDGGLGQRQHPHDLAAQAGVALRERPQYSEPRRMAERTQAGREDIVVERGIYRHRPSSIDDECDIGKAPSGAPGTFARRGARSGSRDFTSRFADILSAPTRYNRPDECRTTTVRSPHRGLMTGNPPGQFRPALLPRAAHFNFSYRRTTRSRFSRERRCSQKMPSSWSISC